MHIHTRIYVRYLHIGKSNSIFFQVHDSSDTASAGSPANTIAGNAPIVPGGSTMTSSLPISFQRSTDQKLGEKLSDIAVVSLVPPVSIGSSHQSSSSGSAAAASGGAREDYDSSATVSFSSSQKAKVFILIFCQYIRKLVIVGFS